VSRARESPVFGYLVVALDAVARARGDRNVAGQ
jgi:hypothetical protein